MSIVTEALREIETAAKFDPVEKPRHYAEGAIECIDAIEAVIEDMNGPEAFLTAQVMKYIWRWDRKGKPLDDLRKAKWYLNRLIERGEKASP